MREYALCLSKFSVSQKIEDWCGGFWFDSQ